MRAKTFAALRDRRMIETLTTARRTIRHSILTCRAPDQGVCACVWEGTVFDANTLVDETYIQPHKYTAHAHTHRDTQHLAPQKTCVRTHNPYRKG